MEVDSQEEADHKVLEEGHRLKVIILRVCMKIMMMITRMNKTIKIHLHVSLKSTKNNSEGKWSMTKKLNIVVDQFLILIKGQKGFKNECMKMIILM